MAHRNYWRTALMNFIQSFRPRQIKGNFMGEDYYGNKYYEIPADPSRGKRRPNRWFEPTDNSSFHGFDLPGEWESWIRHRRAEPPTPEELTKNYAMAQLKAQRYAELEEKATKERGGPPPVTKEDKGYGSFPKYNEYEEVAGSKADQRRLDDKDKDKR